MSIATMRKLPRTRRDRRVTSYCNIWDLVAPEVACPECSGEHSQRLEAATVEDEAAQQDVAPELSPAAAAVLTHELGAPVAPGPQTFGDVNAEASALLS